MKGRGWSSRWCRRAARWLIASMVLAGAAMLLSVLWTLIGGCPQELWFGETIAIEVPALPRGISVEAENPAADEGEVVGGIVITNDSDVPLYVLLGPPVAPIDPGPAPPDRLGVTPPTGLRPEYKLLRSQGYTWGQPCLDCPGEWLALDWRDAGGQAYIVLQSGTGLSAADPRARYRNRTLGTRPPDVAVPERQEGTLTLAYGNRLIRVPFAVTYFLNPTYELRCWRGLIIGWWVMLAVLGAPALLIGTLWQACNWLSRRWRGATPQR